MPNHYSASINTEHYRILFNSSGDAIFVLSLGSAEQASVILEVNDTACLRLGYAREELVGRPPSVFNLAHFPANLPELIQHLMQHGHVLFETIHVSKAGCHIPTEVNLRTFELDGQTRIFSIARDISDRKRLEAALQSKQRDALALLNATLESSMLLDENYRVLAANHVVAQRLGKSLETLIGMQDIELLPTELAYRRRERIAEVKAKRVPITFEDERNGRHAQITINPVIDENGEIHRFAIYALDITERRQIEAVEHFLTVVNQKILEGIPIDELLQLICAKVATDFGFGVAWIGRKVDDGSIEIQASGGSAQAYIDDLKTVRVRWDDTPLGRGPTGTAIRTGKQQIRHVDDARFAPWQRIAAEQGLKSSLAIPLILRGNIYGAFTLYSAYQEKFDSPLLQGRINLLASKICVALEMAMEHEQIKLLSTALTSARNAVMITGKTGEIQWVNPAFTELSGYSAAELLGRQPRILNSGRHSTEYYRELWQTILAGKVWSADAHERRKDGSIYTVQQTITPIIADSGEITHFVAVHEDVSAKLETQHRIEHMASHDKLTGLPNRSLFFDRLGNLLILTKRSKQELGVIFLDLDGFKQLNDTHGHHIGDLLLQAVSQRLLNCIRESDTVARLGGDEFVVILNNVEGKAGAARVANLILQELSAPFQLETIQARIGASLGIALSRLDEGEDALTRRADAAMYQAKRKGKNTYCFAPETAA